MRTVFFGLFPKPVVQPVFSARFVTSPRDVVSFSLKKDKVHDTRPWTHLTDGNPYCYHGQSVPNPHDFSQLSKPQIEAFLQAENVRTAQALQPFEAVRQVAQQGQKTLLRARQSNPLYSSNAVVYTVTDERDRPCLMLKKPRENSQVLIDQNTWPDGQSIQSASLSPNGQYLAYLVRQHGSDDVVLKVHDIQAQKDLPDSIPGLMHTYLQWQPDNQSFLYLAGPFSAERTINCHRLGQPAEQDTVLKPAYGVLQQVPPDEILVGWDEHNGYALVFSRKLASNLLGAYVKGLGDMDYHPLITPNTVRAYPVGLHNNRLYVLSTDSKGIDFIASVNLDRKAPVAQLSHLTPLSLPGLANQRTILAAFFFRDHLFINALERNGKNTLLDYDMTHLEQAPIAWTLPSGVSAIQVAQPESNSDTFFIEGSGLMQPKKIYRANWATKTFSALQEKNSIIKAKTPFWVAQTLYTTTVDGVRLPMQLIGPKGYDKNGKNPVLLEAYGGFNAYIQPDYDERIAQWVQQGGIFVRAKVRGDKDLGFQNYRNTLHGNKHIPMDDLAACAQTLIAQKVTSPQHLAITGRSHGGLLVAGTVNRHPKLFGAVVPVVGLMDVFSGIQQHSSWKGEFGDPEALDQFSRMLAYSPLHNIPEKNGQSFPAVMVVGGRHDQRVAPEHSYRYYTALRKAGHTAYLRMDDEGHGEYRSRPASKQQAEWADIVAFLASTIGKGTAMDPEKQ